jgi:hypothetical protein
MDFKEMSLKDKRFKKAVGLFLDEENVLAIHVGLPDETNGTRRLAIAHELAHARTKRSGARKFMNAAQDEEYCELEAVFSTPNRYISHAEEILKTRIAPGRKWSDKKDRLFIRIKLLHILKVGRATTISRLLAKVD